MDNQELFDNLIKKLSDIDLIHADSIPGIDLYMDQLTTFMSDGLESTKRYDSDKILTKTMINNYTKNKLLPPPSKKKYSKDHMILLIFIYYFKSFLSITDIQAVLHPLIEEFFQNNESFGLEEIYSEIFSFLENQMNDFNENLKTIFEQSKSTFSDVSSDGEKKELLQRFAFICQLGFDIYLKKLLIGHVLDTDLAPDPE